MKIKKENTLLESKLVEEDEVKQEIINPDEASEADIIKDIEKTEQNTGVEFDDNATSEEAKIASAYSNIVYNPYGTSNPGKIKKALQRSLEVALRQKRSGVHSDFPNILIYGQAGVGKTSIVRQFCNEHNLEFLAIDVGKLSPEMIGGIPYPTTDLKTGEIVQGLVANPIWNKLNKPCILFCDEVNRANERAANSLFALINEHVLPGAYKNDKTGEVESTKYFPNFLFTVSNINPPTAAFKRSVSPLDPAFISRNSAILQQEANPDEFAKYFSDLTTRINADEFIKPKQMAAKLDTLYQHILDDPNISAADKQVYAGQNDLVQALISNGLTFNTQDEVDEIYLLHKDQGITYNYLNPRSLSMFIRRCDGTKKDFLDVINNESGLRDSDKKKIKNCLATYTDKITVGNNLFGKAAPATQRTASTQTASIDALNTFLNGLS